MEEEHSLPLQIPAAAPVSMGLSAATLRGDDRVGKALIAARSQTRAVARTPPAPSLAYQQEKPKQNLLHLKILS